MERRGVGAGFGHPARDHAKLMAFQANAFESDAFQGGGAVAPTITTGGSVGRRYRPVDIYALRFLAATMDQARIEAQTGRDIAAQAERDRKRNAALLAQKMREQAEAQARIRREEEWLLLEVHP